MNVKDLKKPTIHNAAKIMTLQCHFECFSTLDVKSSLRFCSYANPEKGRIDFWEIKVAVRIHPACSLFVMQRTNSSTSPSSPCPLQPKAAGTDEGSTTRGISRFKGLFLEQLEGSMFWFLALPENQKNIRSQISPDSSATCLFPPGSYKSGRTDFLGACIEG